MGRLAGEGVLRNEEVSAQSLLQLGPVTKLVMAGALTVRDDGWMTRRWLAWAVVAAGGCALIVFFARIGLAKADSVASVVGMFVGLSGLALSAYTVVQNRPSQRASVPPLAQPTAATAGPIHADETDVADQAAAPEPGKTNQLVLIPAPAEKDHATEYPSRPESLTPAPARTTSRAGHAGTAVLCAETRSDSRDSLAVDRVSDQLVLVQTPDDPTFEYAVDAACSLCGATYRMGVKKKELVPRPGPANWVAAVVCGVLTVAWASLQLWLIPQMLFIAFFEASADHWAEEAFTKLFSLMCALGSVVSVLVLARWSRNQLRVDATHTQMLTGPKEPSHAHVGRIFT